MTTADAAKLLVKVKAHQFAQHLDRVTGAWKQISTQRRRVDVSYDLRMVTALQHNTWMNEERLNRFVSRKRKKGEAFTNLSTAHG